MNQEKIGSFIAQRRKDKKLTQAKLASYLGISDRTISKWERGKGLPDPMYMLELCQILDISVNELLRLLVDVFAMVNARPPMQQVHAALQSLQRLNIIQKYAQGEEDLIWVLPYITCVLTPKRVEEILMKIRNEEGEEDDEAEADAADQLAVLRENDSEL